MNTLVEPDPASPIAESYNPSKLGRFYYFREDGKQVRIGRKFSIDDKSKNDNYDDRSSGTPCRKYYPKVGLGFSHGLPMAFFTFGCAHCMTTAMMVTLSVGEGEGRSLILVCIHTWRKFQRLYSIALHVDIFPSDCYWEHMPDI